MRRRVFMMVLGLAALVIAPSAAAAPGLLVGARDDGLKWTTGATVAVARDLGLRSLGITVGWQRGQVELAPHEAHALNQAVVGGAGMRIVAAVFSEHGETPADPRGRDDYCTYVGRLITRFPQINDVVIWNEPNLRFFWRPQYDGLGASEAPARYVDLLAQCYDALHTLRPSINIIGPATSLWGNDNPNAFSNVSHSPTRFIKAMGAAYRASGRTRPLFDTIGHHPYPARSDERPWTSHADEAVISVGDLDRLLATLREAFDGTAQPLPEDGVPIWYLETGYQTQIDEAKRAHYIGVENWTGSVPDLVPNAPQARPPDASPAPDQASQLVDSLRMLYCQPYVGAVFNFLLRDEPSLDGWQSGLVWADWSRKDSYDAFRSVVHEINEGRVDCKAFAAAPGVAGGTGPTASVAQAPAAVRSVTKLTYRGEKVAPYGFFHPRAQLTRGRTASRKGLAAKQVLFVVGPTAFLGVTDAAGRAVVKPMPPATPGRYRVSVRFSGDTLNLASGLRIDARVVNSKASVRSVGLVRLGPKFRARLSVRSNGKTVRGTLTLRGQGAARVVRVSSVGLRADARAVWLSGTQGKKQYLLHAERVPGKQTFRVRVWRDEVELIRSAVVPARQLLLAPLRG